MLEKRLNHFLESIIKDGPAGVALSVIKDNRLLYENYFGYADIDTKTKIEKDTIYRIYSMTKIVTCVAALQLVEEGKILLNDPLSDYLPEFKEMSVDIGGNRDSLNVIKATQPIRIKDLFKMTSGLTYGGNQTEVERLTSKAMEEVRNLSGDLHTTKLRIFSRKIAEIPLAFEPGTDWRYGISHDILGALIEVVSGMTFSEYLQKNIFDQLGMHDTHFQLPEEKKERLATLYNMNEQGHLIKNTVIDHASEPVPLFESGGAGLHSTLGDYQKFAQCLAQNGTLDGKTILNKHTIQLMAQNHLHPSLFHQLGWNDDNGYGYGLGVKVMIDQVKGGSISNIGEFGWSGLAGTYCLIDPKTNLSIVYMQQMFPHNETIYQPRIRNIVYGSL